MASYKLELSRIRGARPVWILQYFLSNMVLETFCVQPKLRSQDKDRKLAEKSLGSNNEQQSSFRLNIKDFIFIGHIQHHLCQVLAEGLCNGLEYQTA